MKKSLAPKLGRYVSRNSQSNPLKSSPQSNLIWGEYSQSGETVNTKGVALKIQVRILSWLHDLGSSPNSMSNTMRSKMITYMELLIGKRSIWFD